MPYLKPLHTILDILGDIKESMALNTKMSLEIQSIHRVINASKIKSVQPCSLHKTVMLRQLLGKVYQEYPLTFNLAVAPDMSQAQIISIINTHPGAVNELKLYQIHV
eukprot:NODE_166_length_14584_cov_1.124750.p13 type:complete len:107 gc:universal NODE_166_length_14584_cov_1.124750:13735-14055(+)